MVVQVHPQRPIFMNVEKPSSDQMHEWYWLEFMTYREIAAKCGVSDSTVVRWMMDYGIPGRKTGNDEFGYLRVIQMTDGTRAYWMIKNPDRSSAPRYIQEHRYIAEKEMGIVLGINRVVHHRDENSLNNHPFNLLAMDNAVHTELHSKHIHDGHDLPSPCPWFLNHMAFAVIVGRNSHCSRLKVGCVVTNHDMDAVYAFGYNGSARGMSNACDSDEPGKCGCIHAEINALLKVRVADKDKVMFVTHSPCMACVKAILNSGFKYVYYGDIYRDSRPLRVLNYYGVRTCPYPVRNRAGEDESCFAPYLVDPIGFVREKLKFEIRNNVLIPVCTTECQTVQSENGLVTQLAEYGALNAEVAGSTPAQPTNLPE